MTSHGLSKTMSIFVRQNISPIQVPTTVTSLLTARENNVYRVITARNENRPVDGNRAL